MIFKDNLAYFFIKTYVMGASLIQEELVVSYWQKNGLNTGKLPPGGLPRNSVVK